MMERAVGSLPSPLRLDSNNRKQAGMCAEDRDLYQRYQQELEHLLELTPSYPDLLNRRGLLHYHLGDWEAARNDFLQALARNSEYEEARVNLAFALKDSDGDEAVHLLSSIAKGSANSVTRFVDAACLSFHLGKMNEAWDALHHAMALDSNDPLPHHYAAYFAEHSGDHRLAKVHSLRAARERGGCVEGYECLGVRENGRLSPERLAELLGNASANRNFRTIHVEVARWLAAQGERQAAKRELIKMLTYDPRIAPYSTARGHMEFEWGNYHRAERWLRRALESSPNHAAAHEHLAQVYAAVGDDLRSERHLVRAVELTPNFPDLRHDLARICAETDRVDEAVFYLRSCLAIHPSFHMARFRLGECLLRLGKSHAAREQFLQLPEDVRQRPEVSPVIAECVAASARV